MQTVPPADSLFYICFLRSYQLEVQDQIKEKNIIKNYSRECKTTTWSAEK